MKAENRQLFSQEALVAQLASYFEASTSDLCTDAEQHLQLLVKEQLNAFSKKFLTDQVDQELLDLEAMVLFLESNDSMSKFPLFFPTGPSGLARVPHLQILYRAKQRIKYVLGDFFEDEFLSECRHSGGASLGVKFSDTSPEKKMHNLTHTHGVDQFWSYYLTFDSEMRKVYDQLDRVPLRLVDASRACCVPKDNRKSRLICIEPTLNMFFQQGLMKVIERRLKGVGLSFVDQQEKNKYLAWKSSITGSHSTVDFSSASDRISYDLVKYLLPPQWFSYLDRFRASKLEIGGSTVPLSCFSTMGNAYTFPLETLIFWAIAESCCDKQLDSRNVHVFGDDVIIPSEHAALFLHVSLNVGFLPNVDKTFTVGRFRESCGGDYLAGKDVRPFYVTRASQETQKYGLLGWLHILFNRLKSVCIRIHGPLNYIYRQWNLFDCIFSYAARFGPLSVVPTYFPDDAGFKIGVDLCRFRRWYSIKIDRITRDQHGSHYFRYLSFEYMDRAKTWSHLRYAIALKVGTSQTPVHYKLRRAGRYTYKKSMATPWFQLD